SPADYAACHADTESLPEKLADDLATQCAECETQAYFPLADIDRVAERAVDADASERKGGTSEESEQDGAQAIFCEGIGEALFKGSEVVHGTLRLDVVDLPANGFGHGHGSVAGSDEEESARLCVGSAPVDSGNGEMVEAGFADVAGNTDNLGRTGVAQIQGLHVMANDGCAGEIAVSEGAIHDDSGRTIGFAADFSGEQRNAHSREVAGRDEAVLGNELGLRLGATLDELEFGLVLEGYSGNADGDSCGVEAGCGA